MPNKCQLDFTLNVGKKGPQRLVILLHLERNSLEGWVLIRGFFLASHKFWRQIYPMTPIPWHAFHPCRAQFWDVRPSKYLFLSKNRLIIYNFFLCWAAIHHFSWYYVLLKNLEHVGIDWKKKITRSVIEL